MANVGHNTNATNASFKRRVYYSGSGTIVPGMALCYNSDITTDVDGTAIDAGTANNSRWMNVEDPKAANLQFFAGFVVAGNYGSTTGPVWLDIQAPNGQSIEARGTESFTNGEKVYIAAGTTTVTNVAQSGGFVGYAMDTIDRSSTEGLVLIKSVGTGVAAGETVLTAGASSPSPLVWDGIDLARLRQGDFSYGFLYENDFLGEIDVTTADGWTITTVNSGAISGSATEQGGALFIDSAGNNAADDGIQIQLTNCLVKPAAGVTIAYEARVKMNDTSANISQFFVGLAGVDTTLIAAGVLDDVVDKAAFFSHAGTTADKLSVVTSRTSAEDINVDKATVADDTYTTLGMVIDGITSVKFYQDGVLVDTLSTAINIPNAVMCMSFVSQTEGASKDSEMTVDWVRIAQVGGRA